jgi:anti-sigma factor RsiW
VNPGTDTEGREPPEPGMARDATRFRAPEYLAGRIERLLLQPGWEPAAAAAPVPRASRLRRLARRLVPVSGWIAAAAMASLLVAIRLPQAPAPLGPDEAFIDSHARSLLTDHAIDVPSSDRHTVKPWFRGRLDFSPPVVDLGGAGFELLGGRIDYVQRQRVAVLVYRRRQHLIDVFVWPRGRLAGAGAGARGGPVPDVPDRGYRTVRWDAEGMSFVAVADIDRDELAQLGSAFRSALASPAAPSP